MNSHTLQISGTAELPEPLEIGKSYNLFLTADCVSITKSDNQDGSYTIKHRLKQVTCDIVDEGKTIPTRVKGSQSQAFWRTLCNMAEGDEDQFYQQTMTKLIKHAPEVVEYLNKLENV